MKIATSLILSLLHRVLASVNTDDYNTNFPKLNVPEELVRITAKPSAADDVNLPEEEPVAPSDLSGLINPTLERLIGPSGKNARPLQSNYISQMVATPLEDFYSCVVEVNSSNSRGCNNELFEKFDFQLVITTIVNPQIVTDLTKNLRLYQRRAGQDVNKTLYMRIIDSKDIVVDPATQAVALIIAPKKDCDLTAKVYSIFSNNNSDVSVFPFPQDIIQVLRINITPQTDSLILTFSDLGIVNEAKFAPAPPAPTPPPTNGEAPKADAEPAPLVVRGSFSSDIFSLSSAVIDFQNPGLAHFTDYRLPTNQMISILGLLKLMKKCSVVKTLSSSDIKKITVAAEIEKIRRRFCCKEKCKPVICSKVYCDYTLFVSSCIKFISSCSVSKSSCDVAVNIPVCESVEKINNYIVNTCTCVNLVDVRCNIEVTTMFEEFYPICYAPCYAPHYPKAGGVCVGTDVLVGTDIMAGETLVGVEIEVDVDVSIESIECSDSDSDVLTSKTRKSKAPTKKKTEVKTSSRISTYGWYAAGGIVAVAIAVSVYVFVM